MSYAIDKMLSECATQRAEVQNRAVERMLILPGNLGARLYEWIDASGYHCAAYLTDEVEHMTLETMPFGTTPIETPA
jgi:hypothetical protein